MQMYTTITHYIVFLVQLQLATRPRLPSATPSCVGWPESCRLAAVRRGRPDLAFPATGGCAKRWNGRGASPAAPARSHRSMQVRVRPPAAAEGLRAWIRPAVHRARRSRSGSVAHRCRSYSAAIVRGQCCGLLRARRSTSDGCSSNAKTTGYVHLW